MSTFRVPVAQVKEVNKHPNADRLSIYNVFDFQVVGGLEQFKPGSTVIYIPIDAILPHELEAKIFGADSKIKLTKSRVRQIRIRNFASQGLLIDPDKIGLTNLEEGQDVSELLGITKYEPPLPDFQQNGPRVKKERNRSWENPYFHEYGGLENFKFYSDTFIDGQEVVYTEKIHGTNSRAGLLPYTPKTIWQKLIKLVGLAPKYQFTYGSNCVQLQSKSYTGFYDENIYAEACKKYNIADKLKPHETVYFEIYGEGVQKGFMYDAKKNERRIVIFDVKVLAEDKKSTRWLTHDELVKWCEERQLPMVPILYRGPHSKELAKHHTRVDQYKGRSNRLEKVLLLKIQTKLSDFMVRSI